MMKKDRSVRTLSLNLTQMPIFIMLSWYKDLHGKVLNEVVFFFKYSENKNGSQVDISHKITFLSVLPNINNKNVDV